MSSDTTVSQHETASNINLPKLALVIGVIATLMALTGAWVVLPYRVDQAEKNIHALDSRVVQKFENIDREQREQREILIRIDENVKQLKAK